MLAAVAYAVFALGGLLAAGATYQDAAVDAERRRFPPPGRIVDVGTAGLHVYSAGKGAPTVVFIAGFGSPSAYVDFAPVHPAVAAFARVVVYDRAGYGWSGPSTLPRTTGNIARELYALLERTGEPAPYVLVAHSMGAMEALKLAQDRPESVAGVVLVDPATPEFFARTELHVPVGLWDFARANGILRVLGNLDAIGTLERRQRRLAPEMARLAEVLMYRNTGNAMMQGEAANWRRSAAEFHSHGIGDVPLVVLSSARMGRWWPRWEESQAPLGSWSSRSRHIVVEGAGHAIQLQRPALVIDAVRELVRGYGSKSVAASGHEYR